MQKKSEQQRFGVDRRRFLRAALVSAAALALPRPLLGRAPDHQALRLIYSNDLTNIVTCISPYHARGRPFTQAMLLASIDEARAADAQILQPGLGWVPLWRSKVYSVQEHAEWFAGRIGIPPDRIPNALIRYVLAGGDPIADFVTHCRAIGTHPIVSLRLNDAQGLERADKLDARSTWVSRFYAENPGYRIGPDIGNVRHRAQNWAIAEVREHKFAFLQELIEGYDADGVELDFMRTDSFFRVRETPSALRQSIMTEFCARARALLDSRRQAGPRPLLCVRIPAVIDHQEALGLDVRALAGVGVDVFTLSNSFYTSQRNDVEQHRALAPNVKLLVEMAHAAAGLRDPRQPDDPAIMRATDAQLRTTALEALRRGADGIGLFNFAYYREQVAGDPSPGHEPPFYLMPELRDLSALAAHPERHWFVARSFGAGPSRRADWLPRLLKPGAALTLDMRISTPDPKRGQGLLKVRTREASANMSISARINGMALEPTAYVEKPIPHPYVTALGEASQHHCYVCPRQALRSGDNVIELAMASGSEVQVWMAEIVFAG